MTQIGCRIHHLVFFVKLDNPKINTVFPAIRAQVYLASASVSSVILSATRGMQKPQLNLDLAVFLIN